MATYSEVIAAYATKYVGKIPYYLGAGDLAKKFRENAATVVADCSSFVQYIYGLAGYTLPRKADQQYKATKQWAVSKTDLKPGDLLFFGGFNTPENPPGYGGVQHVAIYAGNGKIVEENSPNVQITNLSAYGNNFIAATRIPESSYKPSSNIITDTIGGLGNLASDPGKVVTDAAGAITDPIAKAIAGIGNTFTETFTYMGVILLALVLIIGAIILIRPQTISDVAGAAKTGAMAAGAA